ncbi:MAG: hypothetical protein AAF587_30445 [Bacteroidota bacterium]
MDRIYGIGYSNGSGILNKIAAEANIFRAVATCATPIIVGQEPTPDTQPVSVYQISGMADPLIPIRGGRTWIESAKRSGFLCQNLGFFKAAVSRS